MQTRTRIPRISKKKQARLDAEGTRAFSTITPKPLPRSAPKQKARKPVRKVNVKRRASEFARCYHSRERVQFVKAMPCLVCSSLHPLFAITSAGNSDNAHSVGEGMGRKAGYETIVPLCREHHQRYDQHRYPCADERTRAAIVAFASRVEAAWLARSHS